MAATLAGVGEVRRRGAETPGRSLRASGAEGVRAYGVSPSGVKEWYCVDGYRRAVSGHAKLNGVDLGSLGPLEPRVDFGFSEFPRVPALVRCAPLLEGAERFLPEASARAAAERA